MAVWIDGLMAYLSVHVLILHRCVNQQTQTHPRPLMPTYLCSMQPLITLMYDREAKYQGEDQNKNFAIFFVHAK